MPIDPISRVMATSGMAPPLENGFGCDRKAAV
jgi:hypothetical protein